MTPAGLSASRVRKCAITLKLVLDAAACDNLIAVNPVTGVKPPRLERHEATSFEPGIVEQIAEEMPSDEYKLLIRVLGVGGLRFGEAATLTRGRVDVARRRLMVQESVTELGGKLVGTATKMYQHRQVPLPPTIAEALVAQLESSVGVEADASHLSRSGWGGRCGSGRSWDRCGVRRSSGSGCLLSGFMCCGTRLRPG
jgi:integrase